MLLVAEEEVAGFDVLMQDIALVAIGQGGSSLQGDAAELVDVAVQPVFRQVASSQIGLTIVEDLDDHLKAAVIDHLEYLLMYIKVGIVYLQDIFLPIVLYEEHLCLSRVGAQDTHIPIADTFQNEIIILDDFVLCLHVGTSHRSVKRRRLSDFHR